MHRAKEDCVAEERDEVLQKFLAQPSEQGFRDADVKPEALRARGGWWSRIHHFLFEKKPSLYSSIAPRRADGTRSKIFFFNGNGRGR